jgi:hypothetical protein
MNVRETTTIARAVAESGPAGTRVMCTRPIGQGDVLHALVGRLVGVPDRYSVQLGPGLHLAPDGAAWALINHACVPNVYIDFLSWQLRAARAIRPGEELGWNYHTTEWELSCPFECMCASGSCDGVVRGFKHLSPPRQRSLLTLASPFIRSMYDSIGVTARGRW